jgi:YcxB-like protein
VAESADTSGRSFQFVTNVQASLDARALSYDARLNRLDPILGGLALLIGLVLAASGYLFGLLIAIGAGLFFVSRRLQPIQRWLIARNGRSLLGKRTEVTVGADGFRFSNEVASTYIPWSSVTAVRSNTRTVLVLIDRVIAGYIPASAFSSPGQQANLVRFVQERIAETAARRELET